jgi:hypothetical protein
MTRATAGSCELWHSHKGTMHGQRATLSTDQLYRCRIFAAEIPSVGAPRSIVLTQDKHIIHANATSHFGAKVRAHNQPASFFEFVLQKTSPASYW